MGVGPLFDDLGAGYGSELEECLGEGRQRGAELGQRDEGKGLGLCGRDPVELQAATDPLDLRVQEGTHGLREGGPEGGEVTEPSESLKLYSGFGRLEACHLLGHGLLDEVGVAVGEAAQACGRRTSPA